MDISLINSQSLLHLLSLTEKKEEILQILEQIDAEIIRTLQGGISVEVVASPAIARPAPAAKNPVAVAPIKTVKAPKAKKRTMSAEGRARISAATKARWAARRASKTAKVVVAPKAGKPAKVKKKSGLTPEGRAKLAANMKARWAARRAAKA
ncbi:MAG: hypothetical protein NTV93_14660 [Verrucomicrobia bacterium]|nr:hypothetical protein [Verrucomicrobiota bacterium]